MRLDSFDRWIGGHITFGPVTVYGRNAMHFAVNVRMFGGYLCVRLPLTCFGRWWPLYAYWSQNATPWHHTTRGFGDIEPDMCVCDECYETGSGRYSDPREYENLKEYRA